MRFPRRSRSFSAWRRADPRLTACIVLAVAAMALVAASCGEDGGSENASLTATMTREATPATGGTPVPTTAADCGVPAALPPVFCADVSGMERGSVTHIVDGDTFDVLIDGREERVRFFGIDTPERGEPCFSEATAATRQLSASAVWLLQDARNRDRSGRLLRYVYTPEGLSVDAALIANGFAYAWTADGQHRDALVALEAEARLARRGCLWQ